MRDQETCFWRKPSVHLRLTTLADRSACCCRRGANHDPRPEVTVNRSALTALPLSQKVPARLTTAPTACAKTAAERPYCVEKAATIHSITMSRGSRVATIELHIRLDAWTRIARLTVRPSATAATIIHRRLSAPATKLAPKIDIASVAKTAIVSAITPTMPSVAAVPVRNTLIALATCSNCQARSTEGCRASAMMDAGNSTSDLIINMTL